MRYFIEISYDGSKFYGFQRLDDKPTIQKSLEEALSFVDQSSVIVKGAGRTDRGVHANGQGVHFDLVHDIPCEGLSLALNKMLAPYIYVLKCIVVDSNFHARFMVKQKLYRYRIYLGTYKPCYYDYFYMCSYPLDIVKMKEASKLFLGVHNFQNFVSGKRDDYTAILYDIVFKEDGDFLDILFLGKSFYRYMVRNIVGALLDVGKGKRNLFEIKEALNVFPYSKRFSTAISNGLYLEKIQYHEEDGNCF